MTQCNVTRNPLEVNMKPRFDVDEESVDETTYKQLIGSLRFLCNSRPELMYGVGLLSQFMSSPQKSHLIAAKRVLRYVKGTTNYCILFLYGMQKDELKLVGYTNSDFGGDQVERKSTSGNIFFLNTTPISWSSKKQTIVALSSCEAEYVAGYHAVCQGVWFNEVLKDLKVQIEKPFVL
ncbi:secreted RxLR effector protein 161-like [Vigna angularis]|uniref:secreted RxLR effector protein 161-like n=1 Tax=Phaseolus angularis TaxID=3914 RepID=UPI0022B43CE5|nr:secreted RxLR effector protein 161-like [Vigna angularis]